MGEENCFSPAREGFARGASNATNYRLMCRRPMGPMHEEVEAIGAERKLDGRIFVEYRFLSDAPGGVIM